MNGCLAPSELDDRGFPHGAVVKLWACYLRASHEGAIFRARFLGETIWDESRVDET